MVIISTRAVEVSIHAVSPVSVFCTVAGAVAAGAVLAVAGAAAGATAGPVAGDAAGEACETAAAGRLGADRGRPRQSAGQDQRRQPARTHRLNHPVSPKRLATAARAAHSSPVPVRHQGRDEFGRRLAQAAPKS